MKCSGTPVRSHWVMNHLRVLWNTVPLQFRMSSACRLAYRFTTLSTVRCGNSLPDVGREVSNNPSSSPCNKALSIKPDYAAAHSNMGLECSSYSESCRCSGEKHSGGVVGAHHHSWLLGLRLACPSSSRNGLSGLTILVPNLTKRSRKRSRKWSCDKLYHCICLVCW